MNDDMYEWMYAGPKSLLTTFLVQRKTIGEPEGRADQIFSPRKEYTSEVVHLVYKFSVDMPCWSLQTWKVGLECNREMVQNVSHFLFLSEILATW